jgi:hypothetical protein
MNYMSRTHKNIIGEYLNTFKLKWEVSCGETLSYI